jgi:hypothetical protein
MRCALAPGAALAMCPVGFEADPAEIEEALLAVSFETARRPVRRFEERERRRDVQEEYKDATSSV